MFLSTSFYDVDVDAEIGDIPYIAIVYEYLHAEGTSEYLPMSVDNVQVETLHHTFIV